MNSPTSHEPAFWATVETLKKSREEKLCLAVSSADACQGSIIGAHTIPRSQLQFIAENGHVYCFEGDLPTIHKTQGELKFTKKGIGKFSVLNCFCGHHDQTLFSSVENNPLTFTPEQISVLHYRAIASELYRKITGLNGFERAIADALKGGKIKNTAERQRFAEAHILSTKMGILDAGATFEVCEKAVYDGRHSDVAALVITFRKSPTIMTVGAFSPQFDYEARRIQDLSKPAMCDQVSISILSADGRAAVVLAWLAKAGGIRAFGESLMRQRSNLLTTLLIQTAFEHLENTCIKISWWDSLKEIEQKSLSRRMNIAANPFEVRLSSALTYAGITFDDWGYDGHRFVSA